MYIGMGMMLLAMIASILFCYRIRVKGPVFLRNCIEAEAFSNQQDYNNSVVFQLQYITNSSDKRKVCGVSFADVPEIEFMASETAPGGFFTFFNSNAEQQLGTSLGRYRLRTVYVLQRSCFREEWKGEKELGKAMFQFSDGSSLVADVGRIILYSDPAEQDALNSNMSSSSSNFNSSVSYSANENITMEKISSPLQNDFPNLLSLKLDGVNYNAVSGRRYKKGESFSISSAFDHLQQMEQDYDVYDLRPKLTYRKADTTTGFIRIYNVTWQRGLYDFKSALSYLKKRGAI
jgi:hypothetical protein